MLSLQRLLLLEERATWLVTGQDPRRRLHLVCGMTGSGQPTGQGELLGCEHDPGPCWGTGHRRTGRLAETSSPGKLANPISSHWLHGARWRFTRTRRAPSSASMPPTAPLTSMELLVVIFGGEFSNIRRRLIAVRHRGIAPRHGDIVVTSPHGPVSARTQAEPPLL